MRPARSTPFFCLLLLAACSRDETSGRPATGDRGSSDAEHSSSGLSVEIPADAPTVAFLGDSISAGLGLDPDEAFPAVLQQELAELELPFHLVNAGVSGDTSAGGLRRLDWVMRSEPDVLVLELGGNDGLRGQDVEEVERNLRAIIERAKGAGAKVLLLGMRIPPSLGADYAASFAALYERVATDEDVAFVPFFMKGVGGDPRMNLEDGLHPTAAGHRRLAENVLPTLRRLLAE